MTSIYGIDAWAWPSWQKYIAWQHVDAVMAFRRLHNPDYVSTLTAQEMYDLVIESLGDYEMAELLSGRRAMANMRNQT